MIGSDCKIPRLPIWMRGFDAPRLLQFVPEQAAVKREGLANEQKLRSVCTENLIRIYRLTESAKLAR
jgi:hypothetical protein